MFKPTKFSVLATLAIVFLPGLFSSAISAIAIAVYPELFREGLAVFEGIEDSAVDSMTPILWLGILAQLAEAIAVYIIVCFVIDKAKHLRKPPGQSA